MTKPDINTDFTFRFFFPESAHISPSILLNRIKPGFFQLCQENGGPDSTLTAASLNEK
jgi:hypothetical protein